MMLFTLLNTLFSALYISSDKDDLQKWTDMCCGHTQPLSEVAVMDSNNNIHIYPLFQYISESIKDT